MKEFACGDVVPGCAGTFTGATEDDVLAQVAPHAAQAHGLTDVSPELVQQIRDKIRDA
ncbi:MAG: DUF1059 domain-containing protein [Actinobacteria bacterium]|nr:DUF1059 domain-containing protein [Actinomycetota bacterium]MCA1720913.1 DUF1059 domain-containing protein [Actinomycetota bacterium]